MSLQSLIQRKSTPWLAILLVAAMVFGLAVARTSSAKDLLAAWEFNAADLNIDAVAASGGIAANTTGFLQDDAEIVDGALFLDGDLDYLEFGDDLDDLRTQPAMTIATWVNTNTPVTDLRRIVEHEDNFYFWAENEMFQYTTHGTPGGASGRAQSISIPEVGEWQHVAAVYEPGKPAKMYVNGVLEGTSSVGQNTIPGNVHTFQIGARRSSSGDASHSWDGIIDDVAIWDVELAESAIGALAGLDSGGYSGRIVPTSLEIITPPPPPPPPPSGAELIALWTMDNADLAGDTVQETAGDAEGPFDGILTNGGPTMGVTGFVGEAAEFEGGANNGDFHYIDLSEHVDALGTLTEGTIAAYIKPDSEDLTTDVLTIFAASDADAGSVETRWFVSNGGGFGTGNLVYGARGSTGDGTIASAGVDLLDGDWHHVAVTVNEDFEAAVYIDGEQRGVGTSAFMGELSFVNSMSIGRNKDSTDGGGQWFYDGLIDDLRIYDKAMTPMEVLALSGGGGLPGDFNNDEVLDATDIDMLTTEVRAETHSPLFDLNGDSLVNSDDRKVWVVDLRQTWFGDANMDSLFNSSDLVQAFQRGEYEDSTIDNSTWADGDWNGNGEFESGDLVVAFQEGGYEKGLRTGAQPVPEPSSLILALTAALVIVGLRRRP